MREIHRRSSGFTVMELMIVVAIIGVIAAVAIPNFLSYQARSRRGEAWANLGAIVRAQKAYQAERNAYFWTTLPWPDFTAKASGVLDTQKMPWDGASEGAFANLGWQPEGQVFYAYEVNAPRTGGTCPCTLCFTATAIGDVDADGQPSAVMYVEPQRSGGSTSACKSMLFSFGTPLRPGTAAPVYNEVAINRSLDEY